MTEQAYENDRGFVKHGGFQRIDQCAPSWLLRELQARTTSPARAAEPRTRDGILRSLRYPTSRLGDGNHSRREGVVRQQQRFGMVAAPQDPVRPVRAGARAPPEKGKPRPASRGLRHKGEGGPTLSAPAFQVKHH